MKTNNESGFTLSEPTKATAQTGIRYPTMPSPKHWQHATFAVRPGTTSISLKPKGLGGALDPPRGACSRTDNPRSTSPFLVLSRLYTTVVSLPCEGPIVSKIGRAQNVRSRCSVWKGKKWATFTSIVNTNNMLKYIFEGGFSSKQEIECPAETGPEARTHRPSLSPSSWILVTKNP